MKIYFTNKAEVDIYNIKDFYLKNTSNIKDKFVQSLEKVFYIISEYPEIGSEKYRLKGDKVDIRAWKIKKFPFLVLYTFNKNSVLVLRVVHEKRDLM